VEDADGIKCFSFMSGKCFEYYSFYYHPSFYECHILSFFFFFFFFLEYKYIELHYADKTSRFASTILRIKGGHSPNQILSRERDKAYFANT
jgi:hypothetical protein